MSHVQLPAALESLAERLQGGQVRAVDLAHECLEQIDQPKGEGARAFIAVFHEQALTDARAADARRDAGRPLSAIDGIPLSVKDLFDLENQVTRAGSKILADTPPAAHDAPAIARLKTAGAVLVGRTNMTEFAYGANGINAHYGTPLNAWDRISRRIPGGSTSGGAVSVTDGMAAATIGSDTGGSVRIPAALTGICGFKPTQRRIPLQGAFPLSFTRDSIGPLGISVRCCATLDALMAGETPTPFVEPPLKGLRFGVPTTILQDDLDEIVSDCFSRALVALSKAGATIEEFPFPVLQRERDGSAKANFSAVEAFALHRERMARAPEQFDPRVLKRLQLGANILAADYVDLILLRKELMAEADRATSRFDALLAPTVPIVAPRIAELETSDAEFFRINGLLLRNCAPFNVLDRPCLSLPCHPVGSAPVGLMVIGETMGDAKVLAIGAAIERALWPVRNA
ncbi:MAG TPA: amidase [Usitatibacteraceae bacterium]|nr:amidase [Usitatibacteraceae bacterium]